jgi:hypothetical protein
MKRVWSVLVPILSAIGAGLLAAAMFALASPFVLGFEIGGWRTGPLFTLASFLVLGATLGWLVHYALAPLARWLTAHMLFGEHHEMAGSFLGVVSVIYAVLVAFVVVTAWQGRDYAVSIAAQEQHNVDDLFHLAAADRAPNAEKLMVMLRYYAMYTQDEWYQMRREEELCYDTAEASRQCVRPEGAISNRANELAHCIREFTFALQPTNERERLSYDQEIRIAQALGENREERRLRYQERTLQPVLWLSFILGALILVGMSYCVGGQAHWSQLVRTCALFAMMGMMIALALVFDRPFTGTTQVSPTGWKALLAHFDADLAADKVPYVDLHRICPFEAPTASETRL